MDSFHLLRRRTTELFSSLEHSLPSLGKHHGSGGGSSSGSTMKGTWEKIQVPPLPRSSHSANVVAGTVYIFGGELAPGRLADNDIHAITLPSSGAPADYYAIKPKPAKPSAREDKPAVPTIVEKAPTPEPEDADADTNAHPKPADTPDDRHLSDISLTTPSPGPGQALAPAPHPSLPDVPPARAGHATAVIGHRIFLFGGRGGPDMAPLDEAGRVWVFDTRTALWSFLDPCPAAANLPTPVPHPAPRSDHAAVATNKPDTFAQPHPAHNNHNKNKNTWTSWALGNPHPETGTPQHPIIGATASRATDPDSDGYGTLLIHGGRCLPTTTAAGAETTETTDDVWAFDIRSRVWQRLPPAPSPPRRAASLALSRSRLYRFGGADDTAHAQGGQLDFLELGVDRFDDQVTGSSGGGSGEEAVLCARKGGDGSPPGWRSVLFYGREDVGYKEVDAAPRPDGDGVGGWPGERCAAGMEAVTVGGGRKYIVLAFGEKGGDVPRVSAAAAADDDDDDDTDSGDIDRNASSAGRFLSDVWAFQVPAQTMSLASVADTAFSVVGRNNGEGSWARVDMAPHDDEDDTSAAGPGPRGWAATAPMGELEENGIVVFGGVGESGRRLGDGWILRLG